MTTYRIILVMSLLIPLAVVITTPADIMVPGFFADEAVYFAMIQSLAYDFNLQWSRTDMERICQIYPAGPVGIILKEMPNNTIVYAKPVTYPFFASVFFMVSGPKGIIIFNLLLFWLIITLLANHWGATTKSALFSITTLTLTAFSPYVLWTHPEIFTAFCMVMFYIGWLKSNSKLYASIIMPLSLALAVTVKPPLLLLGIPPAIELLKKKRFRPFLTFFITITVIALISILLTGHLNPYEGNRKIFSTQFPLDSPENLFDQGDSWSMQEARFYFDSNVFYWNLLYMWIGRFSGILWYFFPGIVTAILALFTKNNRKGKQLLLCVLLLLVIQIVMIPTNYHGGGGALGNRYFINLYPLVLFALPKLPQKQILIGVAVVAGLFSGPFLIHPWLSSYQPGEFTRSGVYSKLPSEWTLSGAYPIFHPDLYLVNLPGVNGYFYFLDRRSSGQINNGFKVFEGSYTTVILELDEQQDYLDFFVTGQNHKSRGVFDSQRSTTSFYAIPEQTRQFRMNLGKPHIKTDIYGRQRHVYQLKIQVTPWTENRYQLSEGLYDTYVFFQPVIRNT